MATIRKLPINTKSKIELLYVPDTAKEISQHGKIISIGPLLLSTAHVN